MIESAQARRNLLRRRRRFASTMELLESRALLATLYVNASNVSGIQDGTQAHPYTSIQTAINNTATSGDTVSVAPGTYAESLAINHSLTLLGPNAGIDPNTATRGPEAVVVPPVNDPTGGTMILVTGNNVTINGVTVDGHNPNLTTGTLLNGITSNAASGVTNVDGTGKLTPIAGLTVDDNIIRNLTGFGVIADINDFSGSVHNVSTGNTIKDNLIGGIL